MREKSNAELVGFIIDEVERFAKMTPEERREVSKPPDWPLIYGLPNKHGVEITCGNMAHAALSELSDRASQVDNLIASRCSKNAAFQLYRKHFLRSLMKMTVDGQVDEDRFVERYSKIIRRLIILSLREQKFGIPCVLPIGCEKARNFVVGPVTFVPTDQWIRNDPSDFPESRPLGEYFKRDLNCFSWIAFVSVKKTEPERGQELAEFAVDVAINIIRIFLVMNGEQEEVFRLGHAGGRLPPKTNCGISFEKGSPSVWLSRQSHPYVGDDFIEFIEAHSFYIQMFAGVLKSTVVGGAASSYALRFLDAVKWFGEACLEGRSGAQIVKAVMCLERLFIFEDDDGDGLKARVSKRAAALISHFLSAEYVETKRELGIGYKARSKLMHGAKGPMDHEFEIAPYEVLKLAAQALFSFVGFISNIPIDKRSDQELRNLMMRWVDKDELRVV